MSSSIDRIVVAGGGTAGWLAACRIAAWSRSEGRPLRVTLVEDPDTPTIGVGEGTWPTMGATLAAIGIEEADFLIGCDASFKQGSLFRGWVDGSAEDSYLHPFTLPPAAIPRALLSAWRASGERAFAETMTAQHSTVAADLAPRQRSMPAYSGALPYAYHLDAGKFAALLRDHATLRLGVDHRQARIASVEGRPGSIEALVTAGGERVPGDLFIDCTGFAALLIDRHCGAEWVDQSGYLLNDSALAVQVQVDPKSPIASATRATAHRAGWFWDIGLPSRRGIGCVYSSAHLEESAARELLDAYIIAELGRPPAGEPRLIRFPTGHRDRFWVGNCVAIGLSAGFIEPLEASAIVLIEASLDMLIEGFPARGEAFSSLADRFNRTFTGRWQNIVEFLKLHYVLSRRQEPYWVQHRDPTTIPPSLTEHLVTWADQPPSRLDFPLAQEIFPYSSYQYVYYGMGGETAVPSLPADPQMMAQLETVRRKARSLVAALPTNRAYLSALAAEAAREGIQGELC